MKYLSTFSKNLFDAIDHYKAIDVALARRLVEAVDQARAEIIRFPKIGRAQPQYRRLMLREFPYAFCYRENLDGELVAVVLFHFKKKPVLPGIAGDFLLVAATSVWRKALKTKAIRWRSIQRPCKSTCHIACPFRKPHICRALVEAMSIWFKEISHGKPGRTKKPLKDISMKS